MRALMLREVEGEGGKKKVSAAIEDVAESDLPEGDVLVTVEKSTLNYKDGMVIKGIGRLVRDYPHVPGIDFAGVVEQSNHPDWSVGDRVILTGWRVGEVHWGGYAERARVKGDWLVKMPEGGDAQWAMSLGTAGLTAMLATQTLQRAGVKPEDGPILVTGASGGVGGVSLMTLSALGYTVAASTGRPERADALKALGATEIVDRKELETPSGRPLDSERWAGCIDSVAGTTLQSVLAQMRYGGVIAACGLASSPALETTVLPFLLRGVTLFGIDSVMQPRPARETAWAGLVGAVKPELLAGMVSNRPLEDLPALAGDILAGKVAGRVVIDVTS